LTVDATVGRSSNREKAEVRAPERLTSVQGGVRAAFASERLGAEVAGRLRFGDEAWSVSPRAEGEGRFSLRPGRLLRVEGSARAGSGAEGETAAEAQILASTSPGGRLTVFGSATFGTRLIPAVRLSDEVPAEGDDPGVEGHLVVNDATGWRVGGELGGPFGAVHVAAFQTAVAEIMPFGLAFDLVSPPADVASEFGIEGAADLPVPRTNGAVRLQAWYSRFLDGAARPYAPTDLGRLALVFHNVYYGGQLEPTFRLEGVHRGSALVPTEPGGDLDGAAGSYQTLHFSLHLRILDVSAFLLWDNLLNEQTASDFPGSPPAFPRIVYGASWHFSN
jgi:hypothetical protein